MDVDDQITVTEGLLDDLRSISETVTEAIALLTERLIALDSMYDPEDNA